MSTIAFDLDGTLSDWEAAVAAASAQLGLDPTTAHAIVEHLDGLHPRVEGRYVDRYWFRLVGEDRAALWAAALPDRPAAEVAQLADRFAEALHPVAYPDVDDALDALADAGHDLVALSNSPRLDLDLDRLGLTHRFRARIALPVELRKPEPAGFAWAADQLGVAIADLVYVGDSWRCDVEGALAAGARPVWLDRHDDGHQVVAPVVRITTLAELPALAPRPA